MTNERIDKLMSKLTKEEQLAVQEILMDYSKDGSLTKLNDLYEKDFYEIPVSIDTFIESPEYAGWFTENGENVFPYWREKLREIFDESKGLYEIVLGGSIGCGKTTIAVIGLAYTLYWLMCLKDPNPYFGLGRGDTIYLVFFNATLTLSKGVGYKKFQSLLQHSPWFMARGKVSGDKYLDYVPNKTDNASIEFTVGSQPEHALGKAIVAGLLDEVNFTKGANEDFEKSRIMDTYTAVLARIKSRFIVDGKVRGRLFLVSSKKTEYDFIEAYVRKVKGNPGVFIADARLYELKASAFCGEKFKVAVGGSNMPSRIIPENEDVETYIAQGYDIEEVPIELKQDFEVNMTRALQDHCGIAVSGLTRFLAYPFIEKCTIPQKNPFKSNVLTIGINDTLKYQDFFEPELVTPDVYSKPLFVHFDCSLTGDRTGIGCIAVLGYTNREGYDSFTGEHTEFRELMYREIFNVAIQCPNGSEISFRKDREFIYYLKHQLGWNIKAISLDSYQSADMKQNFITAGFDDTTIVSLDRKPDGYQCLKTAFVERRIQFLSDQNELVTELVNLKQDAKTGKIDHDAEHCFTADTRIQLVDGRSLSISELLLEQQYKDNYVYTFNEQKRIIEPKKIKKVFQTKLATDLIRVTLDNGEIIECTQNHRFMLRDGRYERAINLTEGTALMPLYLKSGGGNLKDYRMYYEPMEEKWHYEHKRFKNPVAYNHYSKDTHKNLHEIHHSKMWITNGVDNKYVNKTDILPEGWRLGRTLSKDIRERMQQTQKANIKTRIDAYRKQSTGRVWVNNGVKNKFVTKEQLATLDSTVWIIGRLTPWQTSEYKNHKVVKIEFIHKPCRVYDLEIEDNHNFALSAGVFVHNSKDQSDGLAGAIYNASLHDGQFAFNLVDDALLFGTINDPKVDETSEFITGLLPTPTKALKNRMPDTPNAKKTQKEYEMSQFAKDSYNGFIII